MSVVVPTFIDDLRKRGIKPHLLEAAQARAVWKRTNRNSRDNNAAAIEEALIELAGASAVSQVLPIIAARNRLEFLEKIPNQAGLKSLIERKEEISSNFLPLFKGNFTIVSADFERKELLVAGVTPEEVNTGVNLIRTNRVLGESTNSWQINKAIASRDLINTAYHLVFADGGKDLTAVLDKLLKLRLASVQNGDNESGYSPDLLYEAVIRILARAAFAGASDATVMLTNQAGLVKLKVDGIGQVACETDPHIMKAILTTFSSIVGAQEEQLRQSPLESIIDFSELEEEFKDKGPEEYEKIQFGKNLLGAYRFRVQLAKQQPDTNPDLGYCVVRILKKNAANFSLHNLGYGAAAKVLIATTGLQEGLVLFVGATGSGKTTGADATLAHIDPNKRWIITIENPIEFAHPMLVQHEIRGGIRGDETDEADKYLKTIKSLLRSNPDVVFFGECRSDKIAERLVELALTGTFVVSTLHSPDAVTAIQRLRDWGIENNTIAATIAVIIGQRLFPKLCQSCALQAKKEEYETIVSNLEEEIKTVISKQTNWKTVSPEGCIDCSGTGYKGKWLAYEILNKGKDLYNLISSGAATEEMRTHLYNKTSIHTGIATGIANGWLDINDMLPLLEVRS